MSEVAELRISLVSQRDEELDQVSAIEVQKRFGITTVTGHVLMGRQKGEDVTVRPVGRRSVTV